MPCYNLAQKIYSGQIIAPAQSVTEVQGVVSTINPATELFNVTDESTGEVLTRQLPMTGGGSQVAFPASAVGF